MKIKTKYKFKPALFFHFLTPLYDAGNIFGSRKKLHQKTLKHVKLRKDKFKLLDIGCGTGEDLIQLKTKYPKAQVYGIDADPKILKLAKHKFAKKGLKVKLQTALAEGLPFKANFFDVTWCSLMLHHLPTAYKKKAIKEMYRVLKLKGKCYLIIFSPPKNPLLAKIAKIQNLFEHTKDNYEAKIPLFVKQAGFRSIKENKIWLHVSLIEARK